MNTFNRAYNLFWFNVRANLFNFFANRKGSFYFIYGCLKLSHHLGLAFIGLNAIYRVNLSSKSQFLGLFQVFKIMLALAFLAWLSSKSLFDLGLFLFLNFWQALWGRQTSFIILLSRRLLGLRVVQLRLLRLREIILLLRCSWSDRCCWSLRHSQLFISNLWVL